MLLCMFIHVHNFLHILEQRIGFAQQMLNMNMKINWYFKPLLYALVPVYFKEGGVGYIHHGRMTSYNICCILYTRFVKVDLMCFILIAHFFLFHSFLNEYRDDKNSMS